MDIARRTLVADDLARRIHQAGATAPALAFLTIHQPLAFMGAQFLWFAQPFLRLGLNDNEVRNLAQLLEDSAGVQALIDRLETLSAPR
jgi:hypothetical protein